jgi:hypothetical protein
MARSSIKPGQPAQDTEVADEQKSTALAPTQDTSAAEYSSAYDPEQYDDTARDIEVPVLGLINNVGPLAKQFKNKAGNFVLGDLFLGETVEVIPTAIVKFFREKVRKGVELKYGSPEAQTAKVWATAADAARDGYFVDFENKAPNRCEEAGRIGYLVVAPQGDESGEFFIRAGDLQVAQAKCSYQRGGFRMVWRKVFDHANKLAIARGVNTKGLSHSQVFLAAQAWSHRWTLRAESVDGAENSWYEPRIARGAALSSEAVSYITEHYGK